MHMEDGAVMYQSGMTPEETGEFTAHRESLGPIEERVYETLLNVLRPKYRLPWVEPIFVPGKPCYEAYSRMHDAYERLRDRLGVVDEDGDVEEIIDCMMEYGRLLAMAMFRYGRTYQQMRGTEAEK